MDTQLVSHCPHCRSAVKVRESHFGQPVRCPACREQFAVSSIETPFSAGASLAAAPAALETLATSGSAPTVPESLLPPPVLPPACAPGPRAAGADGPVRAVAAPRPGCVWTRLSGLRSAARTLRRPEGAHLRSGRQEENSAISGGSQGGCPPAASQHCAHVRKRADRRAVLHRGPVRSRPDPFAAPQRRAHRFSPGGGMGSPAGRSTGLCPLPTASSTAISSPTTS